jgi:hypothetical protein
VIYIDWGKQKGTSKIFDIPLENAFDFQNGHHKYPA